MNLRPTVSVLTVFALLAGCAPESSESASSGTNDGEQTAPDSPSPFMYVWAGDMDPADGGSDFLAVVDADPDSPTYGDIVSSAPVGSTGNNPHHAEPVAPAGGVLFANGFSADRTFLFDITDPAAPALDRPLDPIDGYRYLHSFARGPDGYIFATAQTGDSTRAGNVGGLAKFDGDGNFVAVASAEAPGWDGRPIRPYAVEVFPEQDRVITTSSAMLPEYSEDVIQVWRGSDLELLATVPFDHYPAANEIECSIEAALLEGQECTPDQLAGHDRPFEVRRLADGSAFLNTLTCGFYHITGLEGEEPAVHPVLNWENEIGCAVPTVMGDIWVMPLMFTNQVVTLDVSDPMAPVEMARMTPEVDFGPHWAQGDPVSNRVAMTGIGEAGMQVRMYVLDPATGALSLDPGFADGGILDMNRALWPHGEGGMAMPHAVLFGR
ncbi:MAG TPA: hypothetical protein VJ925_13700 [Longimicrobiales bacterium]|nr:hypothetical protein [Longimicrobiales bacterium]